MITAHKFPSAFPRSREYLIEINGESVDVLKCDLGSFAIAAVVGEAAHIKIRSLSGDFTSATIHPRRLGVAVQVVDSRTVTFSLPEATPVFFRGEGLSDLYLLLHDREDQPPSDPSILRIPAGEIVEVPLVNLEGFNGLHIEAGAVLRTRLVAIERTNLRITGQGIFDGSFYTREKDGCVPSIVLDRCHGTTIADITMVNPAGWMILLGASDQCTVRNVRQLGKVISSDGIDVVGSSDVLIEDCFISNNDDCVAVKAFTVGKNNLDATQVDGNRNVRNVAVRRCVFHNGPAGNAMEVGHELTVDSVCDIRFQDIDVLAVHGTGAVFAIHNGDHATVENILFEDIRIEHCYDKLIDFRVMKSRFNTDPERGRFRNVILRDIAWTTTIYNLGYTISIIGGWDAQHGIENVLLQNFRIDGRTITSLDDIELFTRHAPDIQVIA